MSKDKLTDKQEAKIKCFVCKGNKRNIIFTHEYEDTDYYKDVICASCKGTGSINIKP